MTNSIHFLQTLTSSKFLQEGIALLIVGLTALWMVLGYFRTYLAPPFSKYLLKKGRLKSAFWMRKQVPVQKGSCANCKSC